ncbi:MAG: nickel pincer cofactor biosynthesis protein LarB [Pseudomonadota bacterium]|nr:nickel pincer cofactor biosynthesis protein LarB [Pseudomonadota bacterium]
MGDERTEIELDFDRRRRTGLDETIFAQNKSAAQLEAIFAAAHGQAHPLFITRLSPEKFAAVSPRWKARLDYCAVSNTGIFCGKLAPSEDNGTQVCIIAAGSSDVGVAREAERTLHYNGVASTLFIDVGVAGLWRLTSRIDAISRFPVVIAVAGMDAALPTVLGGLIPGMIIAVPTSVGYGVAAGGHAALNAILASCAPGITTVNIDNGYGAACAAIRALRMARHTTAVETHEFQHQPA